MGATDEHACPSCGVLVATVFQHREMALKDLPVGERPLSLRWRKRRYACPETRCPRWTFTETSVEVPPRHRLTGRLRRKLESAASGSARALSDVGREYSVSWWSVHRALLTRAAALLPDPAPVRVLGLDETRARSVRWLREEAGWRRSECVDDQLRRPRPRPSRRSHRVDPRPQRRRGGGMVARAERVLAGGDRGGGAGPVRAVRRGDSAGAAPGHHRGRPLAPGAPGQRHGHRGSAAGRPRAARPPRPQGRPGLGAPSAAAAGRRPAVRTGAVPVSPGAPPTTRRTRSPPPGRSRSCCGRPSPPGTGTPRPTGWSGSTRPAPPRR